MHVSLFGLVEVGALVVHIADLFSPHVAMHINQETKKIVEFE